MLDSVECVRSRINEVAHKSVFVSHAREMMGYSRDPYDPAITYEAVG